MVGHTGVLSATVTAVEHVDECLGQVLGVLREHQARVFVTADHGNAEFMINEDGTANTAHTTNPVPLLYLEEGASLREGAGLSDLAPTVLCLLGLEAPREMTGQSLC
jgi:2,3-bisphosphoglycerate-independent phosphoglycerate mutase